MSYVKTAYFTSWSIYSINYKPNQIPVENLTHLLYAFANISNGEIAIGDAWSDTQISYGPQNTFNGVAGAFGYLNSRNGDLRRRNPNIKTLISIGGWTWSKEFSRLASTPQGRTRFARSVAVFVQNYGFDGADIDWEYPVRGGDPGTPTSPNDGVNFVLLLREIRNQLNAIAYNRYQLSVATSASPDIAQNVDMRAVSEIVDHINVMSYGTFFFFQQLSILLFLLTKSKYILDFSGAWEKNTFYNSNLYFDANRVGAYSIDNTINFYLNRGVPSRKLVIGTPFCGKIFKGVEPGPIPRVPGLNSTFAGVPNVGELPGVIEAGIINQTGISQISNDPQYGFVKTWDNNAKSSSLYSRSKKIWITFEDEASTVEKCNFVKSRNLGGIMTWELSQDSSNYLTSVMKRCLP
ncbi:hypothetical protein BB561_002427 [Smittium simulii]|uniref:GH18 domain-containing protein n=1 Tax=Smittium simulii TaxID=133385 RepID=A0A2T9YQG8_9FUNG|nr:hypothetical protein BB561_002427 [Smittium simulii]